MLLVFAQRKGLRLEPQADISDLPGAGTEPADQTEETHDPGEAGGANGPEYISASLQNWANRRGIRIEHIQPGNPQQNAYVERFNRTVRYEWLAQYLFDTVGEVQDFATQWVWNYNHERPNMALGGFTPKQRLAMAA